MDNISLEFGREYNDFGMYFANISKFDKDIEMKDDVLKIRVALNEDDEQDKIKITYDITDSMVEILKKKILRNMTFKTYKDIYPIELDNIYNYSLKKLKEKDNIFRDIIFSKVYEYLLNEKFINVDGFINFRLRDFFSGLSQISEEALEEYLLEKDYNEFIQLLKYFVSSQSEKEELLKVHIQSDGVFKLLTKDDIPVDNDYGRDMMNLVLKENLNYEDFLISMLITLCPSKIIIYDDLKDNMSMEIINMVKAIFEERVSVSYKS